MVRLNYGVFEYNIGAFLRKIGGWCNTGIFCAPTTTKVKIACNDAASGVSEVCGIKQTEFVVPV